MVFRRGPETRTYRVETAVTAPVDQRSSRRVTFGEGI